MNREEAIKKLEVVKKMKIILPDTKEAVEMAIQSLNNDQKVEIEEHKTYMLRMLFNRCRAMTLMSMCQWCGISKECEEYSTER